MIVYFFKLLVVVGVSVATGFMLSFSLGTLLQKEFLAFIGLMFIAVPVSIFHLYVLVEWMNYDPGAVMLSAGISYFYLITGWRMSSLDRESLSKVMRDKVNYHRFKIYKSDSKGVSFRVNSGFTYPNKARDYAYFWIGVFIALVITFVLYITRVHIFIRGIPGGWLLLMVIILQGMGFARYYTDTEHFYFDRARSLLIDRESSSLYPINSILFKKSDEIFIISLESEDKKSKKEVLTTTNSKKAIEFLNRLYAVTCLRIVDDIDGKYSREPIT